jgi:hypothetical protein
LAWPRSGAACQGAGQLAFAAMVGVCVVINPGLVLKRGQAGLSNYGLHLQTAVPYTIAFVAASLGAFTAARRLSAPRGPLARSLVWYGGLNLVVLVTSYGYSLDVGLRDVHILFGSLLLILMSATATWISVRGGWTDRAVAVVTVGGLVLAAVTLAGFAHDLFVAQAACAVGFGELSIRACVAQPAA